MMRPQEHLSVSRAPADAGRSGLDLLLLLSLVLLFLLSPQLGEGHRPRVVLGLLTFLPLIFAAARMSGQRGLLARLIALITAAFVFFVAGTVLSNQIYLVIQWTILAVTFGLVVSALFSYLRQSPAITADHLYTAASIYLLLALLWTALYSMVAIVQPDSFRDMVRGTPCRRVDLLYFSLITLTTVGYGDIVPVAGEARMLAALEAGAGVLYIAITVAVFVSSYKRRDELG